MRICLSIRRRCSFLRARRNRAFIVSVLLLVIGLYFLGYQKGSLPWDKEDDSPLPHAQHDDLSPDERLQLKELDKKDDVVGDLADETQSYESVGDVTDDGNPGLEKLTKILYDNTDDSKTRKSKSLVSESMANIKSTVNSLHPTVKGKNSYTRVRMRDPSTSRKVIHESQTSLSTISINDAFTTTTRVRIPETFSLKSPEMSRKELSEKSEASSVKTVTKIPKITNPPSRSQKKTNDKMLINRPYIPSNSSNCPQKFLGENIAWSYGKCMPHRVSRLSCQIVKQFYQLDPSLTTCRKDLQRVICNVSVVETTSLDISVQCNRSVCREHTTPHSILVLSLHPKDGFVKVNRKFQTVDELEQNLPEVIKMNIQKKLYFVFLRCILKGTKTKVSQFVPIDPVLTVRRNHTKSRDTNQINVNILLLDSVSRAHFYRSLPKTIQVFKTWKQNPKDSPAKVFDFELFQALEGHTAENTHALFNGKLLPPDPTKPSDRRPVNPGNMFGKFSRVGYQTMWQEDLCWTGGWGLMVDMGAQRWRELTKNINNHSIDHTGLTHSSCEILVSLGVNSPFFGPLGDQICYNGRFQHSYLLQYTLDTIKAITSTPTALPLLSYMSLSVGHDHIGRRIQSLDPALVQYVTELSMNENTLTVILSDHGNTYTSYTSTLEGRFEMFHPHLFLIVPNKVAQRLGDKALDALRINQHRLVNIIDLHHSIMALTKPLDAPVTLTGLFTPISAQRTCQDFELRLPNLCVCEGWDNPTSNDDMKMVLVEFALGNLNNQIENQLIKKTKANSTLQFYRTRSCNRFRATVFKEVRERRLASRGTLITSMLINVPGGSGSWEDVFNVIVESRDTTAQRSLDMKFLQYDRMSMYGQYRGCADHNILLKLCICSDQSNHNQQSLNLTRLLAPPNPKYVGQETVSKMSQSECIYLITRTHKSNVSFAYQLANVCKYGIFLVSVNVRSTGMKLTRPCPFNVTLFPDNIKFVLAARKEKLHQKSSITFRAQIIKQK